MDVTYDAWDRVASEVVNGVKTTYNYDAMGRQVQQTTWPLNLVGTATRIVDDYYDGSSVIQESASSGSGQPQVLSFQYVYSADGTLMLRDRNADGDASTGGLGLAGSGLEERLYVLTDPNGSTTALVDTAGKTVLNYTYTLAGSPTAYSGIWDWLSQDAAALTTFAWTVLYQGTNWQATDAAVQDSTGTSGSGSGSTASATDGTGAGGTMSFADSPAGQTKTDGTAAAAATQKAETGSNSDKANGNAAKLDGQSLQANWPATQKALIEQQTLMLFSDLKLQMAMFELEMQSLLAPKESIVPVSQPLPSWVRSIGPDLQILGGEIEMAMGSVLIATSEHPLAPATIIGGSILLAHGADNAYTGMRGDWDHTTYKNNTRTAIEYVATQLGASQGTSEWTSFGIDFGIPIFASGVPEVSVPGTAGAEVGAIASRRSVGDWLMFRSDLGGETEMTVNVPATTSRTISLNVVDRHFTPNALTLNKVTAFDFYTNEGGFSASRALKHMEGIDFSQPVSVVELAKDTLMQQYYVPSRGVGNYFAPPGTTPLQAGLALDGQILGYFQNAMPVRGLRSFAAPDYIYPPGAVVPGSGAGGGVQYFIPNKVAFVPASH